MDTRDGETREVVHAMTIGKSGTGPKAARLEREHAASYEEVLA